MGYEDQYKQSMLNMPEQGCAVLHIRLSACITRGVHSVLRSFPGVFILYSARAVRLFWNPSLPEGFQELIAACHASQEGHLSQWWTSEELAGQRGLPLNVLSKPQQSNCDQVLRACGRTASPSPWWLLVYSLVYRLSCQSVSYFLTKWNFHFLVCKWASLSLPLFDIYLFSLCDRNNAH